MYHCHIDFVIHIWREYLWKSFVVGFSVTHVIHSSNHVPYIHIKTNFVSFGYHNVYFHRSYLPSALWIVGISTWPSGWLAGRDGGDTTYIFSNSRLRSYYISQTGTEVWASTNCSTDSKKMETAVVNIISLIFLFNIYHQFCWNFAFIKKFP